MKVGIVTFHFAYNCGAVLQCLALSEKLKQMGHEVCVINYQPWYHKNRYAALKNPIYYARKCAREVSGKGNVVKKVLRGARGFVATVYSWRRYPEMLKIDKNFSGFTGRYLNTTKIYRTLEELRKDPPKCDVYISGSDQLWNAKLTENMIDPVYLLEFGDDSIKKITYSMGVNFEHMLAPVENIKPALMRLDAISLREKDSYDLIRELTNGQVKIHIDIDPTFLLKKEEYDKYMSKEVLSEEPFIMTYTMSDESQEVVYQTAQKLSEKTGIKVIDVSGNPQNANRRVQDNRICGPDDFLWYVRNAEYVVTNSFHGTAFSVTFEKEFVTIPHSKTGYRMTEILDKVGLDKRYSSTVEGALACLEHKHESEETRDKLAELRAASVEYLESQIN